MNTRPDRIYIDKDDSDLYDTKFEGESFLQFKGKKEEIGRRTRREQFLVAMAVGFRNGVKQSLKSRKEFFFTKDLTLEEQVMLSAIAIHDTGSPDVLAEPKDVFRIAEEYAHAGISILVNKVEAAKFGSFDKIFEKEMKDIFDKCNLPEQ